MGEIFTAIGQVVSTGMQTKAMKVATDKQLRALREARDFVYAALNPEVIGAQAAQQDVRQALGRLALQNQVDPELLRQRYAAQDLISRILPQIGEQSNKVSGAAVDEALAGLPRINEAKQKLIDAAIAELDAGATLPPDVQAELVRAGLEQAGTVTQAASGTGLGGNLARKIIGTAAVALQQQRQQQASNLLTSAQNLETQRQNILQSLFPRLAQTQQMNVGTVQNVLKQSNDLVPNAGLSGADIANIWLARVGATNQINQSSADIAARNGLAQAQAWGQGMGQAFGTLGSAMPTLQQSWPTIQSWFSTPNATGAGSWGSSTDIAKGLAAAAALG